MKSAISPHLCLSGLLNVSNIPVCENERVLCGSEKHVTPVEGFYMACFPSLLFCTAKTNRIMVGACLCTLHNGKYGWTKTSAVQLSAKNLGKTKVATGIKKYTL